MRVLRPSSSVLVRGTFSDRPEGFPTLFHCFPRARDFCRDLPTVEESRSVRQQTCGSLREFLDRSRLRADSSFALMSDDEFHAGRERLKQAVRDEVAPSPVIEKITFLAFRAGP